MNKFDALVENMYHILKEADMPAAAPAMPPAGGAPAAGDASALPGMGGGAGGAPGGMPGAEGGGQPGGSNPEEMDSADKRKEDPVNYVESILEFLIDPVKGITPEMFSNYVDAVGLRASKIKDKNGLKQFYNKLYQQIESLVSISQQLKKSYGEFSKTVNDMMSNESDPNAGGGGVGQAGPAGPGV